LLEAAVEKFRTSPRLRSTALLVNCSIRPRLSMAFMFENLDVYQKAVDFAD
jgi:hypothetical protein